MDVTEERVARTIHFEDEDLPLSLLPKRFAWCLLIVAPEGDVAGLAIFLYNYAAWSGEPGLYLEELYVVPKYRSRGYAMQLIEAMAKEGQKAGCVKIEWVCLKRNARALAFYSKMGGQVREDWALLYVDEAGIQKLAASSKGSQ
ncbi:acyl-CoA N-acyltransferase [Elsinoe ampelina]|uniref:Acyl-CoA N-acyltransferase n=1 Tax=Elsinoe ampelina TaxID=302913 RepID=A0A6A6GEU9_9PEZI|nr:acyl-CoA N-acyltransferase [Elsinoe ampelina]